MTTAFVYHDRFLQHDTGPNHPERPQRLHAIRKQLEVSGLMRQLMPIAFTQADMKWIRRVHSDEYLARLDNACRTGQDHIDVPDSAICPASYEIAKLAVGGVLAACDTVQTGLADNAFCAVRPPGHHAERHMSMGFCLLNNIAIAAEYLIKEHGLKRVAIVDFDVHHGNGTQHIFEERKDVLYISVHEHPDFLFPGTGYANERGRGRGEGFTLNLPIEPPKGDEEYRSLFEMRVVPALREFNPQFVLVSAGFDAAKGDPLAHMEVSPDGFAWMTNQLVQIAQRHCDGRLVSMLEGGYKLETLAECVEHHVQVLVEAPQAVKAPGVRTK
jgi:acetoin utilization deacetylase AcuC-like enzyme